MDLLALLTDLLVEIRSGPPNMQDPRNFNKKENLVQLQKKKIFS